MIDKYTKRKQHLQKQIKSIQKEIPRENGRERRQRKEKNKTKLTSNLVCLIHHEL